MKKSLLAFVPPFRDRGGAIVFLGLLSVPHYLALLSIPPLCSHLFINSRLLKQMILFCLFDSLSLKKGDLILIKLNLIDVVRELLKRATTLFLDPSRSDEMVAGKSAMNGVKFVRAIYRDRHISPQFWG